MQGFIYDMSARMVFGWFYNVGVVASSFYDNIYLHVLLNFYTCIVSDEEFYRNVLKDVLTAVILLFKSNVECDNYFVETV